MRGQDQPTTYVAVLYPAWIQARRRYGGRATLHTRPRRRGGHRKRGTGPSRMAAPLIAQMVLGEAEGSVSEKSNREVAERYVRAIVERDLDAIDELRHADYVEEWPQSGERTRGIKNARAILENYPGGLPPAENAVVKGSEDRWVATPVGTVLRIVGSGDVYTGLFTAVYPGDPRPWHLMGFLEMRDGKVAKQTIVFGAPFDPPARRSKWVERM